jgi:hypothetical protein
MRSFLLLCGCLAMSTTVLAQGRDSRSVAAVAVSVWNDGGTLRVIGAYELETGRVVDGTVAVLNGPARIGGRVSGDLIAINADVQLEAGADIGGDLIVVGGVVRRVEGSRVAGEVRTQAELLRYTMDGDRIIPDEGRFADWRPQLGRDRNGADAYTELFFVAARTYNRVEGLPVLVGPRFRRTTDWGRVQVEALGVVRTAEPVRWDRGTIGHDARAELRWGVDYGLVLGGRLFDVVEPVESWQLLEKEAGLATFLLHRDLRDHYGRHGAEGTIGGRIGEEVSLHFVFASERWRAVDARRPWSLLKDDEPWRVNPGMDAGTIDLIGARLNLDTRERTQSPWTGGWFMRAELERGEGSLLRNQQTILDQNAPPLLAPSVTYTRGFVDARRYNNLSPGTQLNFRIVAGGQIGGDELPAQRKLSMGGPGSVEGYDFRRSPNDDDVFTCGGIATKPGRATLCDRIALAQIELRQDFYVQWVRTDRHEEWWRPGFNGRGQWVLFADAGRGWTVGDGDAAIRQDRGIPPLSSFRSSLGLGVDFGGLGFYLAKSVTTGAEPVNFLVRLGRRF